MVVKIPITYKTLTEKFKITKRGDGRYFCRIPISYKTDANGKKTYQYKTIYGVDENDVRMKQGEYIEQQIQEANHVQHISEMFITKLEEWLYVRKFQKVKPNSFDRLENTIDFQIRPALEYLQIQDIRLNDVTTLHIEMIMKFNLNKGYSYSTLLKVRRLLVSFFSCYEDEIAKNPMKQYEFYTKESVMDTQASLQEQKKAALAKIEQRKAEIKAEGSSKIYITEEEAHIARMKLESQQDESDIHYFNDEEINKIKDAIQHGYRLPFKSRSGNDVMSALYHPKQGGFFLFLLYTGLRCGEAVSLKYSDVDFDDCTINVCRNTVNVKARDAKGKATGKRNRGHASVKTTNSKQLLAVSPYAIDVLRALRATEPAGYNGYIVHNDSFQAISSKTLWQRFDKLLRGAGVERCGLHSLRHTCATLLYEKTGGDIKFVSNQLRHKDAGFTAKTYVHQSNKRTREVLKDFQI